MRPISIPAAIEFSIGIRVIADHSWGFSGSMIFTKDEIARVAKEAVEIARSGHKLKREITLTDPTLHQTSWSTPYEIDPFDIPQNEKISFLQELDDIMLSVKGINIAQSMMMFKKERKYFHSSEGSYIEQEFVISGGGIIATAISDDDVQYRSYPKAPPGLYQGRGYEAIRDFDFKSHAERVGEEAVALLSADPCPVDQRDIILMSALKDFLISPWIKTESPQTIQFGTHSQIKTLPAGFSHDSIIVFGKGIRSTYQTWGEYLRIYHNLSAKPLSPDIPTTYLGYYTDNGAAYYYHTEKGTSADETLIAVKEEADKLQIPYHYYHLDSFGMADLKLAINSAIQQKYQSLNMDIPFEIA